MIINNTGYSSIKIFCESKHADVNINNAHKIWTLNQPIVINNPESVRMLCSVESVSLPLSYYTTNATNNQFKVNNTTYTVPEGNYSATTMKNALNELNMGINFLFDSTLSKFVLNSKTIEEVPNSIYSMLGLEPRTITLIHTAPHVCNLIYTTGVYLSLNNTSNDNIDTFSASQSSPCLIRLNINQPTNTYLQFYTPIGFKNVLSTSVLNQIDISILDDNRKPLQLTDNVPWVVVLRVDFERNITETIQRTKIQERRAKIDSLIQGIAPQPTPSGIGGIVSNHTI